MTCDTSATPYQGWLACFQKSKLHQSCARAFFIGQMTLFALSTKWCSQRGESAPDCSSSQTHRGWRECVEGAEGLSGRRPARGQDASRWRVPIPVPAPRPELQRAALRRLRATADASHI